MAGVGVRGNRSVTYGMRVLAVDLGATSIRVAAVDLARDESSVDIIHRWPHEPVTDDTGSLRWDWPGIVTEVERGLGKGLDAGPVASIGVDGWGVDYGLLDSNGRLVDQPFAYRDSRTSKWNDVATRIGESDLYGITGIQLMGINTIFQLAADTADRLASASHLLLLPDLLVEHLTGWVGCELSNMSTTGLMDARTKEWSFELIDAIGIQRSLFPPGAGAGTRVGEWRHTDVHLVGSHDTASAFLGAPIAGPGTVVVSTGSWVVVGVERAVPEVSEVARSSNFSNEAGALGGTRFLKNVVGFWILEQCRSVWGSPSIEVLVAAAEAVDKPVPTFDALDHRFVSPDDMLEEVLDASGLSPEAPPGVVTRSIIESIADAVLVVVQEVEATAGFVADSLALIGGGARISLLARLLEKKSGLEVVVGSPEAAALGNAVAQGIALGRFADLNEARRWLTPSRPVA